MEEWKDVKGYEGYYQVSNYGNVRSTMFVNGAVRKPRIKNLSTEVSKRGRVYVSIYKNGYRKNCTVHRLVATAFIPNPDNLPDVNHIDGDPTNNNVCNLEWCTKRYNSYHAYHNGLSPLRNYNDASKKPIIRSDGKIYSCAYEAAKDIGLTVFSIRDVLKGRSKTGKGYGFSYLDQREWGQA